MCIHRLDVGVSTLRAVSPSSSLIKNNMEKADDKSVSVDVGAGEVRLVPPPSRPHLERKVGGKEVQLFAIGGAIGTSALTYEMFLRFSD